MKRVTETTCDTEKREREFSRRCCVVVAVAAVVVVVFVVESDSRSGLMVRKMAIMDLLQFSFQPEIRLGGPAAGFFSPHASVHKGFGVTALSPAYLIAISLPAGRPAKADRKKRRMG